MRTAVSIFLGQIDIFWRIFTWQIIKMLLNRSSAVQQIMSIRPVKEQIRGYHEGINTKLHVTSFIE